jgi:hypothetical protein
MSLVCPQIVSTDLNGLLCKICFPKHGRAPHEPEEGPALQSLDDVLGDMG